MSDSRIPDLESFRSPPRRTLNYEELHDGEAIGQGGQAIVRRAKLSEPEVVAVKEPLGSPESLSTPNQATFEQNAEIWRRIDDLERSKPIYDSYEHIVGVVDIGDELPWIAMEYMNGGSLADRIETNPDGLPVTEALWIGECLCRGMEIAHDSGVAHLDLKPANVLFRKSVPNRWDVPKIGDWGFARELLDDRKSVEGLSPNFAAPEQFDPERFGSIDKYTDIYQLGAVVYFMLTGQPPYTGSRTEIEYYTTGDGPPRAPSGHRAAVPSAPDEVVLTALSRAKTDRYRGQADRFANQLREVRTELRSDESRRDTDNSDKLTGTYINNTGAREDKYAGGVDGAREQSDVSSGIRTVSPDEALQGANVIIGYEQPSGPTLSEAGDSEVGRSEVNHNLRLEYHHARFDLDKAVVNGQPFDEFLVNTIQHRFVEWVVTELIHEIVETGNCDGLHRLYKAISESKRAEFDSDVTVPVKRSDSGNCNPLSFDVVLRDRTGTPLVVANLNTGDAAADDEQMTDLINKSRKIARAEQNFAGVFCVTTTIFEPTALQTADAATENGGLLDESRLQSYVELSRRTGFHLCLIKDREETFHVYRPDL
jgi:serine/threonine protein kinase